MLKHCLHQVYLLSFLVACRVKKVFCWEGPTGYAQVTANPAAERKGDQSMQGYVRRASDHTSQQKLQILFVSSKVYTKT